MIKTCFRYSTLIFRFSIIVLSAFIIHSCSSSPSNNQRYPGISDSSVARGKAAATIYCQSCHAFPDPSLLDTKTWITSVLPNMGPRLGIFNFNFKNYPSNKGDRYLDKDYYPSQQVISNEKWQDIMNYYAVFSPDSLARPQRKYAIQNELPLFSPQMVPAFSEAPTVSFVKIDESGSSHHLFASDAATQKIFRYNDKMKMVDSLTTLGPIVDIRFKKDTMLACNIGFMNPTNGKFGKAEYILLDKNGKMKETPIPVLDQLARPVQITAADLDRDGKEDFLICEFGYLMGGLTWMKNLGNGKFERHVLSKLPGAIKAYISDENHDGLPDIWVLFAHGEEGIYLFTNKGNGQFSSEELIRFPPVFGSSYFELDDFNHDGFEDILYTCGDNGDLSGILKPYHGIYIYLNDGNNHFRQKYFFPMDGCYKAIAKDFDQDGDLDIASIAFFADYANQPEEGFVYLENKGNFNFEPHSLPEAKSGRWLTMDAGDLDGDGRPDLVLGNFSLGPTLIHSNVDWTKGPLILFLKNMGKAH